jgi:Nucleotidyl transferase AbiEii toxin, Type IV TA system
VLAEKLTAALTLAEANTRDRDWADLWRLTGIHDLVGETVHQALARTAAHRKVRLQPLSQVLTTLLIRRQASYAAWQGKQGSEAVASPSLPRSLPTS